MDMNSTLGRVFRMTIVATDVQLKYKETYIPRAIDAASSRNGYATLSRRL